VVVEKIEGEKIREERERREVTIRTDKRGGESFIDTPLVHKYRTF
jgi:hypothetical protein